MTYRAAAGFFLFQILHCEQSPAVKKNRNTILAFGLCLGFVSIYTTGCTESSEPSDSDQLVKTIESTNFVYRFSEGDGVDSASAERCFRYTIGRLELKTSSKYEFFKYKNRDHITRLTGRNTNGFAEPGTHKFHTVWSFDGHECAHAIVTTHVGFPPALFTEGIAMAFSIAPSVDFPNPLWNATRVDVLAKGLIANGSLPPLDELLESNSFRAKGEDATYPLSGSFVHFLLDSAGVQPLKSYFASTTYGDSRIATREKFQVAYGSSIDDWWSRWKDHLRRQ